MESVWIPQSTGLFSYAVYVIPAMLTLDEEALDNH
jgi:hypothetical protein